MRKIVLAATVAVAALSLAACSEKTQDSASDTATSAANDFSDAAKDALKKAEKTTDDIAADAEKAAADVTDAEGTPHDGTEQH
jgi:maltose-binding protein MalE